MSSFFTKACQRGVTLIELLIGVVIGLLAILVISQTMLVSEGQKRTATAGSNAQVSGALAMQTMQRDVQAAGYGISSSSGLMGCTISAAYSGATPTGFPTTLQPVRITRATGSMLSDSVRILASSKSSYTVPTKLAGAYSVNDQSFTVNSTMGYVSGDMALVGVDSATPCSAFAVTAAPGSTSLPRTDAGSGWNAAGTPNRVYPIGSFVANLGALVDNTYEVKLDNNVPTLQVSSYNATTRTYVVRNIQTDVVAMRAFYGRDNAGTGIVGIYDTQTPTTSAEWERVQTVRLLVVARSSQYEQDQVTRSAPWWDVGTTPAVTGAANVTGSAVCNSNNCIVFNEIGVSAGTDVEANHYRYKVFEVIVPLRNLMWKESFS